MNTDVKMYMGIELDTDLNGDDNVDTIWKQCEQGSPGELLRRISATLLKTPGHMLEPQL